MLVSGRAARDARRIVSVQQRLGDRQPRLRSDWPEGEELLSRRQRAMRDPSWHGPRADSMPLLADVPGVILEDKVWTLSVHYRLADPAVVPKLRTTVEEAIAPLDLRVTDGKMVFEIRPTGPCRQGDGGALGAPGVRRRRRRATLRGRRHDRRGRVPGPARAARPMPWRRFASADRPNRADGGRSTLPTRAVTRAWSGCSKCGPRRRSG